MKNIQCALFKTITFKQFNVLNFERHKVTLCKLGTYFNPSMTYPPLLTQTFYNYSLIRKHKIKTYILLKTKII